MPDLEIRAFLLALAILLDWLVGDPKRIYSQIFHPVQFMGEVLSWFEGHFNNLHVSFRMQRIRGASTLALYLMLWGLVGAALTIIFDVFSIFGLLLELVVVAILLGGRSLYLHIEDVCEALKFKTIAEARIAVGKIVGRDTSALDEHGVARAAIETGAENLSDGFIAPAFYYLLFGLPGIFIYKAVNTADSMIGYKTQRFIGFGWAAARLDDILNYIPARVTGFLIVFNSFLTSSNGPTSFETMVKDAGKHSSPNAGWPEAAMAGSLQLALAGPRVYSDMMKQDPWINARGRLDAGVDDIWQSMQIIRSIVLFSMFIVICIGIAALL